MFPLNERYSAGTFLIPGEHPQGMKYGKFANWNSSFVANTMRLCSRLPLVGHHLIIIVNNFNKTPYLISAITRTSKWLITNLHISSCLITLVFVDAVSLEAKSYIPPHVSSILASLGTSNTLSCHMYIDVYMLPPATYLCWNSSCFPEEGKFP